MIQFDVSALDTIGEDLTTTRGAQLTAGSANVKGAYVELAASSSVAAHAILVTLARAVSTADYLVDIAVGAAASEVVLVPNLLYSGHAGSIGGISILIPVGIAAGVRISARCQSTTGSAVIDITIVLIASAGVDATAVEACGVATADSGGTSIDPGAVAHTMSGFVQLIASTAFEYQWLIVAIGGQAQATRTAATFIINIAVGGAGSEVVRVANIYGRTPTNLVPEPRFVALPVPAIAAGSRISAQAQSSLTTATQRLLDCAVYGIGGQAAPSGGGGAASDFLAVGVG